jgi:2,3-bisphosphoglycerate-dependent phosphoglycerate mutase
MAYLVLVRHGTSEYNAKGIWAGWHDPALNDQGKKDAEVAAETLKDIQFDLGYISSLQRHKQTLEIILKHLGQEHIQVIETDAVKERNYGDFTGKNKWEVKEQLGEEEFLKLRRSWDYPVPNGESMKQVSEREIPFFESDILPKVKTGKNVIIASSGNSLRTLVKHLENISDEGISKVEIAPGEVYVYNIDSEGKIINKEIRNHHELTV